ncbi:lipopolysaccharide assembly protein LapA domain-containing protein [Thermodesulfobacteriota bacterium]
MSSYKRLIAIFAACLVVIFIIQNAAVVEVQIFFWTIAMSRVLLMLIFLAIGIIAGWFIKSGFFSKDDEEDYE